MDVEPCYPWFFAELESAEALASSQQKFQTLNLVECNVKAQAITANDTYLLPNVPGVYDFESQPDVLMKNLQVKFSFPRDK